MRDERLRALERAWQTSGDERDEVAYLTARLRAGELPRERLALAALLEHPAARAVLPEAPAPDLTDHHAWAAAVGAQGEAAALRAVAALARAALPTSWPRRGHPEDRLALAVEAVEAWLRCPCPDHQARVREARHEAAATTAAARGGDVVRATCAVLVCLGVAPGADLPAHLRDLLAQVRLLEPDEEALLRALRAELVPWALGQDDPLARHPDEWGERLGREPDRVQALAVMGDGRLAVSGSAAGTLHVWDLAARRGQRVLPWPTRQVRAATFSRDGRRLAASGDEGGVTLWEPDAGRPLGMFDAGQVRVDALCFLPCGRLVTGGLDGTVRLWGDEPGAPHETLAGHDRGVSCLAADLDGRRLASGGADGRVVLWALRGHVERGRSRLVASTVQTGAVQGLAFLDDERLLSACYDGRLHTWRAADLTPLGVLQAHSSALLTCAVAPGGQRAATADADGVLRLWDLARCQELRRWTTYGPVLSLAFLPRGEALLAGQRNGALRLFAIGR